jgi:hypothetical protein
MEMSSMGQHVFSDFIRVETLSENDFPLCGGAPDSSFPLRSEEEVSASASARRSFGFRRKLFSFLPPMLFFYVCCKAQTKKGGCGGKYFCHKLYQEGKEKGNIHQTTFKPTRGRGHVAKYPPTKNGGSREKKGVAQD